jgi:hypothetical protein
MSLRGSSGPFEADAGAPDAGPAPRRLGRRHTGREMTRHPPNASRLWRADALPVTERAAVGTGVVAGVVERAAEARSLVEVTRLVREQDLLDDQRANQQRIELVRVGDLARQSRDGDVLKRARWVSERSRTRRGGSFGTHSRYRHRARGGLARRTLERRACPRARPCSPGTP